MKKVLKATKVILCATTVMNLMACSHQVPNQVGNSQNNPANQYETQIQEPAVTSPPFGIKAVTQNQYEIAVQTALDALVKANSDLYAIKTMTYGTLKGSDVFNDILYKQFNSYADLYNLQSRIAAVRSMVAGSPDAKKIYDTYVAPIVKELETEKSQLNSVNSIAFAPYKGYTGPQIYTNFIGKCGVIADLDVVIANLSKLNVLDPAKYRTAMETIFYTSSNGNSDTLNDVNSVENIKEIDTNGVEKVVGSRTILRSNQFTDYDANHNDINTLFNDFALKQEMAKSEYLRTESIRKAHFDKFTAAGKSQYVTYYKQLEAGLKSDDYLSRLALQLLLVEGKLTDSKLNRDNQNLLEALNQINPMATESDKNMLLKQLIREVALPAAIIQPAGRHGTCAPTAAAITMAMNKPSEYVRIVLGLASTSGKAQLLNGDTLFRDGMYKMNLNPNVRFTVYNTKGEQLVSSANPSTMDYDTLYDDGSSRTISQRLWQSAFMEYDDLVNFYLNGKQAFVKGQVVGDIDIMLKSNLVNNAYVGTFKPGMFGTQMWKGLTNATGTNTLLYTEKTYTNPDTMIQEVRDQLNQNKAVQTSLKLDGGSGHRLVVTKIDSNYVYLSNPWGTEERMSLYDFKRLAKQFYFIKV